MIPYTLIVTSASRPHCLKPTLRSLVRFLDQPPAAVLIHDDAVVAGRWQETTRAVEEAFAVLAPAIPVTAHLADPPRRLGPAVAWLLDQVHTEYVLYSQDDHVAVRPMPVAATLDVMQVCRLHHVRFNKRATLAVKDTWAGPWEKVERRFCIYPDAIEDGLAASTHDVIMTVSDHWYFQLSIWRVAEMQRAISFWRETPDRWARFAARDPEEAVNHYFDHVAYGGDPLDPRTRTACQRTFIWGPIGTDRFIRHIGGSPADWRGDHVRSGGSDDPETAWREIHSYPNTEGLRA